jgi:hypothetical protein
MISKIIFSIIAMTMISGITLGSESKNDAGKVVEKIRVSGSNIIRVGGNYRVEQIEKMKKGTFKISFVSVASTGRFDRLILNSDHTHVSVAKGDLIRLSAEILKDSGSVAEVAQMVVFLKTKLGQTPVWLLSNKAPLRDLRATRYLKMHAPTNDLIVL